MQRRASIEDRLWISPLPHAAHRDDHGCLLATRYVLRPRPWCPPRPPHASPRAARSSARTCAASAALAQHLPPASRAMRARSARARATSELLRPLLHACDRRHEWRGLGASLARTRAHCSVVAARSRLRIPPRQCDPRPSRARALVSPVQASSSTLSPSAPSRPTLRPMVIPTTAPPTPPSPMPAHQLSRRRRRPLSRRRPSRSARSAKHPSPHPLRRRRRPLSHRRPRRRARPRRACPASDRSPANPK